MLHDQRSSNKCDSETQENTDMSEVGGRKESFWLTDDNLKQNYRDIFTDHTLPYIYSVLRLQAFFWILEPWGWDWQVVLQCLYKITITCCIITQKSAVLKYLTSSQHTLTFWRQHYFFNFSTPCIQNVNNTGTKYVRFMKQTAFWRGKNGEYVPCLKYSVPIFVEYIKWNI